MTEKQQWMVHPRSGLAHYTRLSLDPAFSQTTICRLEVDGSWVLVEEPKRKCGNCEMSVELGKLGTTREKQEKQIEIWKKWDKEKEKGKR